MISVKGWKFIFNRGCKVSPNMNRLTIIAVPAIFFMFFIAVGVAFQSFPNPPSTITTEDCFGEAVLTAEPVSLNNTPLVRVDASCFVLHQYELWKIEWLRYRDGMLIQDIFQEPAESLEELYDTYLYPNTATGDTRIEMRFWSRDNECICTGNISLQAPVTPTPIPTTGSQYEYQKFIFGNNLDENGTLYRQVKLRVDAGPSSFLEITLNNGSRVSNVTGAPKTYISYQTISVTGEVPGTGYTLYELIPPGLVLVSDGAWEIGPASWWFVPNAVLTIAFNELRIPPGNAEAGIRMYRLDPIGGGWLLMPDTVVNPNFNTVTTNVSEMGVYALYAVGSTTLNTITTGEITITTTSANTTTTVVSTTTEIPETTTTADFVFVSSVSSFVFLGIAVIIHNRARRRVR